MEGDFGLMLLRYLRLDIDHATFFTQS